MGWTVRSLVYRSTRVFRGMAKYSLAGRILEKQRASECRVGTTASTCLTLGQDMDHLASLLSTFDPAANPKTSP